MLVVSVVVGVLVVGGLLSVGFVQLPEQLVSGAQKIGLHVASNSAPISLAEFKNGFASVIDPDLPAVVNILASDCQVARGAGQPTSRHPCEFMLLVPAVVGKVGFLMIVTDLSGESRS